MTKTEILIGITNIAKANYSKAWKINHLIVCIFLISFCNIGCTFQKRDSNRSLKEELYLIIDTVPGTVGIAVIYGSDTITVNNSVHYPMMSVFKMHQALAVANKLGRNNTSIDTIISINVSELDPDTWSPMLEDYGMRDFEISVRDLIKYALTVSDNNASNILFKHIITPKETDVFIHSITNDTTFRIRYAEEEMKQNHNLAYLNYTSPQAAASLIKDIFRDTNLVSASIDSIRKDLTTVSTGKDRLGAVLQKYPDIIFAHKTGSGYRNEVGELIAHNDVGYFRLPDGRQYSIAILIRDFDGSESEASAVISQISETVLNHIISIK